MTDSARDPIMRVLMANGSIPHLSSHPASPRIPPVSPSSDGNGNLTIPVPINRATTPSLTPLPYNPDVVHLETSHSLAELRSLLASTGVVPSVRPTPRHVESANLLPSLLESRAASALPGSIEAGLRDMLHAQQEQLALLMSEKALRDIDNSKTQEKIYLQQIERQQQQQEHEDFSKILSDRNKPSQGATQVRRKPATPGGIMKGGSHANLPSNRAVSGDFSRSNSGLPGAEKLKQMLRFVGVKKDATQDNLGGPSNTRLNTAALHPTSRMTSYATAFEGVTNDRNISDLSKRSGDPNIPHRPFKGTAGARRVISSTLKEASYGGNDSQPSVIEHASYTISDSPPLTDICLSDYDPSLKSHGKEHGVSKLTLQSQTEIDLPSRMDDIYGQVRALMLSQDALRTQNANAMREALDTILESHNARLGGVEDAVSNWTQRKIEDARNRLTDALRRFEREERRKIELERQAERERSRTKDLQRSAESNLQKGREVRHQVAHDASGASQKRRESGLRAYIERQGKEAESRWRSVHDTGIQRSGEDHKGKLPMQDHPDYTGDALGTDFVGPMQYARIESWVDEQRRMSTTSSKHGKSHKPRLSGKETGTQTTLCEAGGHLVSGHHIPVISPACEGSAKFQQHNNFVARRFLGDGSPPAGSDTHP
ncbi:hypothetical protein DFS34DRAFT_147428 [Phlyctochytrium arcticum]|nr:hypothetical protein DFS34DRAFT_147428 [Phlyctochytrium arcticum]